MFHVVCVLVVLLLRADSHPEEVLWLLPLINNLGDKHTREFDRTHIEKKKTEKNTKTIISLLISLHVHLFAVGVVEHAVHDVLGQFGFVRVGSSAHPRVNDALIVGALKRYLEKTHAVTS